MRILAGLFCVLFLFAGGLQWNDPDPLLWMGIYGIAALLAAGTAAGRGHFAVNAAAALLFGAGFCFLVPSLLSAESAAFSSFEMQAAEHEAPRESIGLLLCAGWCAAAAWHARRLASPRSRDPIRSE